MPWNKGMRLTGGAIAGRCILYRISLTSFKSSIVAPSGYNAPSLDAPSGRGAMMRPAAPEG